MTLLAYPAAATWYTDRLQAAVITEYHTAVGEQAQEQFLAALAANEAGDYAAALRALEVEGSEAIGRILIPSVGIDLPVFPTSTPNDLHRGAGHLQGTAAPVGGEGTHSAITAHSGMPTASMFDRLPEVEKGDVISLHILGHRLTYRVIDTVVDTPQAGISRLLPDPTRDLLTLVTCTPYGVNTHRLLVSAERVGISEAKEEGKEKNRAFPLWLPLYVSGLTILMIVTRTALQWPSGRNVAPEQYGRQQPRHRAPPVSSQR